ncbi:MAG: hypothetical protein QXD02_04825 [Candidatus Parvarchaeum sp.]|nr:hypothetical protein [Candidatus Parvarchaeum tengchongense]
MKLVNIKKVEDCIDSGTVFEYFFDEAINEESIRKLGRLGRLQYYDSFSKPFFKVIADCGVQIKGIVGDLYIQITFPKTNLENIKEEIEKLINDILKQ